MGHRRKREDKQRQRDRRGRRPRLWLAHCFRNTACRGASAPVFVVCRLRPLGRLFCQFAAFCLALAAAADGRQSNLFRAGLYRRYCVVRRLLSNINAWQKTAAALGLESLSSIQYSFRGQASKLTRWITEYCYCSLLTVRITQATQTTPAVTTRANPKRILSCQSCMPNELINPPATAKPIRGDSPAKSAVKKAFNIRGLYPIPLSDHDDSRSGYFYC